MTDGSNSGFRSNETLQGETLGSGTEGASRPAPRTSSRRGFAAMDPARQREIASKGGRAAHAKGTAHEWSADEAREAGRKGGVAVSQDREHMAAIGREGGGARGAARRRRIEQERVASSSTTPTANRTEREQAINVSREIGTPGSATPTPTPTQDENRVLGSTRSGEELPGSSGVHRDTGRSDDRL